ncbi:natterin-3-like [Acipenser oxyrinchus oxyrinchus]|uniref:Natterin-3-like n=1 Tax=Acipenser oxyrinchus oxyrinchus TaxID=40147 RepID=A0AAD8FSI8_ACIOX|nr:natterin-3-like [Acipenser oxyrinchus oxyrinchus]
MKPVLLVVLALMQLSVKCVHPSSAPPNSLKEIVEEAAKTKPGPILNPSLEGIVPPLVLNSAEEHGVLAEQNWEKSHSIFGDNINLKWVSWNGTMPNGAMSIWNGYAERVDYVCKFNCEAGFYNPSKGPYCRYPYADKEYYAPNFELLVNQDHFEFVEWIDGSYGSVPTNAIKTCSGVDIYVGKNKYGLGKVATQHEAFFLPWEGDEYWYKKYQVLSINRESYSQHISHVQYGIDQMELFHHPPETLRLSSVSNNECQTVKKTVNIEKTTEMETSWDIGRSTMLGITSGISAKIPLIGSVSVDFTAEKTFQFSKGTAIVESISHSISLEINIPPNHSCTMRMEGKKITADIPFIARLSRTYVSGDTHWTTVAGKYNGVQIGELKAVVDRCQPIADAEPCPNV